MSEPGLVTISADIGQLVDKAYGFFYSFLFAGTVTGQTTVYIEWHDPDVVEFVISNLYSVGSKSAAFALYRDGWDVAVGTMARGDDGLYRGSSMLSARSSMRLPGASCEPSGFGWQHADVVGVPIAATGPPPPALPPVAGPGAGAPAAGVQTPLPAQATGTTPFYNAVHRPTDYTWISGAPTMYLRLEFYPRTAPQYDPKDNCQDEIPGPRARSTPNFIPLNDAQWTIEGHGAAGQAETSNRAGYAIAVPDSGEMVYEDRPSENQSTQVGRVDLTRFMAAKSIWYVTVTRTKTN